MCCFVEYVCHPLRYHGNSALAMRNRISAYRLLTRCLLKEMQFIKPKINVLEI